ncbi:MAG: hypothetical protein QOF89_58 [Acidobacteriota bacterium]|jgi:hypothetical protein|nr:hypothetical protein [Acidobacteriota bacterium]
MKRNVILSVLAVALLAAPAVAAPPFGWFGGVLDGTNGVGANGGSGIIPVAGWALDDNGIQNVDILVDGTVVGRAFYGMSWPGVLARYPGFPDSDLPGFGLELDSTHFLNGLHTVQARVRTRSGEVKVLEPRRIQFTNNEAVLEPFGKIDFPRSQVELRGSCDLNLTAPRRLSVVYGYALDSGVTEDDYGVAYVELLIDRAVVANSDLACRPDSTVSDTGDPAGCYGLLRLDVEKEFPSLKDSPHSGFRFVLDIGALVASPLPGVVDPPYSRGHHVLTIRAGDHANQARNIAEIPVTFSCDQDNGNENAIGNIDQPLRGLQYHGVIQATGWAIDFEGVSQVLILVDGTIVGFANYGIPRPDVQDLYFYAGYPNLAAPGWRFALDTTKFADGEHFLEAVAVDNAGVNTYIGKRRFIISNEP